MADNWTNDREFPPGTGKYQFRAIDVPCLHRDTQLSSPLHMFSPGITPAVLSNHVSLHSCYFLSKVLEEKKYTNFVLVVHLEKLQGLNAAGAGTGTDTEIILQPRPTNDPNDPLNWPRWRKYLNFGLATFYAVMAFAQMAATTPTWGSMEEELGFDAVLMCVPTILTYTRPDH